MSLHSASLALLSFSTTLATAQHIDSVHVFREIPARAYNSALAATTAWQLHHQRAPYATIDGAELDAMNKALAERKLAKHLQTKLPKLAYLGFAYSNGAAQVVGVMEDLDRVVNFTARREYLLEDWADRMKVRALLMSMGL